MYTMSAAHRSLPIPTYVQVTNLANQRSIVVRINDRGPFHNNRVIDLSYAAAAKLDMLKSGTARVEIRALQTPPPIAQQSVYLQIASFANKDNAVQLLQKIYTDQNLPARIFSTDSRHRVQVGPAQGAEQAAQFAQILASLGYPEPLIVTD